MQLCKDHTGLHYRLHLYCVRGCQDISGWRGSLERQSVQRKDEGNTFLAAGWWPVLNIFWKWKRVVEVYKYQTGHQLDIE